MIRSLIPSVKRQLWRLTDPEKAAADAEFERVKPQAIAAGRNKCVFCGVKSERLDVHHLNDRHSDNRIENLVLADVLCHSVNHLGELGKAKQGLLSFIPGVSQVDINHLLRTIGHVLLRGNDEQKREASSVLQALLSGTDAVKGAWGTANPLYFGEAMLKLSEEEYQRRDAIFAHMGVVIDPKRFLGFSEACADTLYKSLPIDSWGDLSEGELSRAEARRQRAAKDEPVLNGDPSWQQ